MGKDRGEIISRTLVEFVTKAAFKTAPIWQKLRVFLDPSNVPLPSLDRRRGVHSNRCARGLEISAGETGPVEKGYDRTTMKKQNMFR